MRIYNPGTMTRLLALIGFVALSALGDHDVIDITADFDNAIKKHDVTLVKFYAPWCGHCKNLAPEFEKASVVLKKNDPPVSLADVDCTSDAGKHVCSKYGVSGYPTLKIFRNGEVSQDYNGPRKADGIIKFMKAQVGPSSKEISTEEKLEALSSNETIVFGVFTEKDSALHKAFIKVADKNREQYMFVHTHAPALAETEKLSNDVVLIRAKKFYNIFESSKVVYDGPPDTLALESFVKKSYFGLVGHRTKDNYQNFETPLLVAYYDVDYEKNPKGTNYWRNRIMKAVVEFSGKLTFAVSNKEEFAGELDEYNLKESDKPMIGIRNKEREKFRMDYNFTVENLKKFVKDYFSKKLTPYLKSEDVPNSNDGPVKVAVAKNFDELVMQSDKDVLLEFYAPWCGHCQKLAPTYEEVGQAMEGEDVLVVKMDATANDVPAAFEVKGFPTLYWVPKNNKANPVRYDEGREAKDFIKYIAKHATDELKNYNRLGDRKKDAKSEL
ncbi:protein disulfide-isomerase A3-like [Tropilaelaps mercedesae]|uniref:Protein disulfide-isomerase n=1 Tax=Tropilaelaps mercedesae TaxID=418985 RepID=A0A1V9XLS3_9ACAR|nr:protein disulfide-isomerase A3-like [Tropilaelaps mercedesae]